MRNKVVIYVFVIISEVKLYPVLQVVEPQSPLLKIIQNLTNIERFLSEDGKLNFSQLATKYGFPKAEDKTVITKDGYILKLHHIPGDRQRPVLLAHGAGLGATSWLMRGNSSLGIILARRGYDVWALNFRGTTLSQRHLYLNAETQEKQFYNFSFYEEAVYDLPATIDLILKETNQTRLLAIGFSSATTCFHALGSEKPEYNDKIKVIISLAPFVFLKNIIGAAAKTGQLARNFPELSKNFGISKILNKNGFAAGAFNATCFLPNGYNFCIKGIIFPLYGPDPQGFEPEFMNTFFGHYPQATSSKFEIHSFQIQKRDKFAKFDYGPEGNMIQYGSSEPPEIDLRKSTMKAALFAGRGDYLSTVPDIERLRDVLPNVVHYKVLPYNQFSHFDFVWGRHMPTNFYPFLLPIIDQYID